MCRGGMHRRIATWLLMLPGPFSARTHEEAVREALRVFDPTMPSEVFEEALRDWGYAIRRESPTQFSICPDGETGAAAVLDAPIVWSNAA